MTNLLKKYWFVLLLSIFLVGITVYYVYDTNKDKLPGKRVNNEDIVYSIANENVSANQLYDSLYKKYGINVIYTKLLRNVTDNMETSEEMEQIAKLNAQNLLTNLNSNYNPSEEARILASLRQADFHSLDDLEAYIIHLQKVDLIQSKYLEENMDIIEKYLTETKARFASHILVSLENEDVDAKMKEIDKALEEGKNFSDVAREFSDDKASAVNGGSLGFVNKDTSFVPEFLEACLNLNEAETSKWVKTQFGYHKIYIDASTYEKLKDHNEFYFGLNSYDKSIYSKAIWNKFKELNIDFMGNSELETNLKTYMNIEE